MFSFILFFSFVRGKKNSTFQNLYTDIAAHAVLLLSTEHTENEIVKVLTLPYPALLKPTSSSGKMAIRMHLRFSAKWKQVPEMWGIS